MKYNKEWLNEKINGGQEINCLLFWGHKPSKNGSIIKSCFSQWWQSPFVVEGKQYKTAEHWMMEKKAVLFDDPVIAEKILLAADPGKAKSLGRKVAGYNDLVWKEHREQIVVDGNYHKFSQHDQLKYFLLSTGDAVIVEASPTDAIWGIGISGDNPDALEPGKWRGLNLLGFALMEVRDKLQSI
ncbi:MAG: NADAR family protein [Ferruginibacter sp.]